MLLPHTLYIITGANRGFGQAVANSIASKAKHNVTMILVGRQRDALDRAALQIQHLNQAIKTRVIPDVSLESATAASTSVITALETMVTNLQPPVTRAVLVNNAGSTGDLSKKVSEYDAQEIQTYLNLNVASYIALVSGFIRLFHPKENSETVRPFPPELTIVNISSLLAVQPFANWGLYASGKAARDMLLGVVAKEEESVRTLSYAPGPLDNEMQKHVRETLGDAEQKKLYSDMANEKKLVSMSASADKLVELLQNNTFESGAHVDFFDL